ncbi:PAS domain S-box protein [Leptolyngbya ohadii]|uniref:PAS domain S-box protein n=1 Tax=Leptolyngbya ohadii TaxID=1962290 RepID=UPI000B59B8DA|nr:PAS domain S-box protein [Leptolyngbya ohadii]
MGLLSETDIMHSASDIVLIVRNASTNAGQLPLPDSHDRDCRSLLTNSEGSDLDSSGLDSSGLDGSYRILEADSAIAAVELCQSTPIAAILLVSDLEASATLAFTQEFMQALQTCLLDHPPVILVTRDQAPSTVVQVIRLGVEDYLVQETLTTEQIHLAIQKAIRDRRTERATARATENLLAKALLDLAAKLPRQNAFEAAVQQLNRELSDRVVELQRVIDIAPVGIGISTDPSCAEMRHNAHLREMLGVSPGQNISKSAPAEEQPSFHVMRNGEEIPPEDLPMQLAARLGVEVRDTEIEIVLPSGRVRHLLSYASPVRDEQNQIKGAIGTFLDITDRKQIEAELREQHEQLINTLESITDAFFSLDEAWRFTFVNPQAAKLLQKTQAELLGKNVWSEFPEAVDSEFDRAYRRAIAEQVTVQFEAFYPPLDGWFEVRAYPTRRGLAVYFRDVTPRKVAEAERERLLHQEQAARAQVEELLRQLAAEQSRLEQVLQQMPIGISISAVPSGQMLYHNEEAVRILRHPLLASATYEGYGQYGAFHPNTGQPYQPQEYPVARSLLYGEVVKSEEMHYHCGNGTDTIFSVSAAPIFNPTGEMTAVVCAFDDIARLKQVEARLRESEERLRLALNATGMGIWDWEVQHDRVTWAGNNERLFGLPQGTFAETYEAFLECVHPDDRATVQYYVAQALQEKRGYTQEFRIVYPDGTIHWLRTQSELFLDDRGDPARLIGTNQDITALKQSQAEREQLLTQIDNERRFLEQTLQQMPLGVVIAELPSGNLTFHNDEATWLLRHPILHGRPQENYVQYYTQYGCIHPGGNPYLPEEYPIVRSVLNGEVIRGEEVEYRRGDGTGTIFSINAAPILDQNGQRIAAVSTFEDISERKRSEQEREQLLATAQIARQEAEAANRSKDDFVALVAHELRSPLNAILGWAKLLQTRQLDTATTQKALETIVRNTQAQVQLIEDLLDVSRIVRSTLQLDFAPVNLADVVEAALETVRPTAEAKPLQLETQLRPTPLIWGDADRLQQVVLNLLTNAIKFTPAGGKVAVRLEQLEGLMGDNEAEKQRSGGVTKPENHQPDEAPNHSSSTHPSLYPSTDSTTPSSPSLKLTVTDTGKGISSDFLPHIFERFQQDRQSSAAKQGLGLGLAIVKYIVEHHGGTITAQSRGEGQGAKFTVILPPGRLEAGEPGSGEAGFRNDR